MPRLDRLIGRDWRLTIAGACGSRRARALAGERVEFLGRVEDLSGLYDRARLFVAPTRFSAGIPHKVHEAAAFGLPVVATPALAAQLDWTDGEHLLHAADAEAFAAQCARLYADAELWGRIRAGALARVAVDCDPRAFDAGVADLLPPARASLDAQRLATAAE